MLDAAMKKGIHTHLGRLADGMGAHHSAEACAHLDGHQHFIITGL